MKADLFNEYYEYKKKTVNQYSILLSKILGIDNNKIWKKKRDVESSLSYITNIYFNKIINDEYPNKSLIKTFIDNKDISPFHLDLEMMSVIEYFINNNEALEIPAYEKEIILIASIIKIANLIDVSTSPYKKNRNNYNTIVLNYIERFNNINFFNNIDDGKKNTNLLIELIKTNVRKERKIFDLLTSSNSFNRYVDISKENKYYLTQYNYNVNSLNKYDKYGIKLIYEKNNIDDKFLGVSADLIVISLMKLLSLRKSLKVFFLPIKSIFFEEEQNIKDIEYILKDDILKKHICILINYNEFSMDILEIINKYDCTFYIYCSKNSKITDGNKLKGCNNYLVSEDFYIINKRIITRWMNEDVNIIKEHFDGIITDKELIEEQ